MSRNMPVSRILPAAFWACVAVHLVAIAAGLSPLDTVTKALLMPLLAAWVWLGGAPRLLVAGLLASTAGDVALDLDGLFLAGMACFAVAHVCYVTMFLKRTDRRDPRVAAAYAVVWLGLIVVLWPGLGDLRIPIAVYSLLLTATAVTSLWYGVRAGIGGGLFLLSDTLIAFDLADIEIPQSGLLVMVTYIAAQYLIATGSQTRERVLS